jgi:TetR/AcrR family transcriptional regulator, lmrAB and yxaGH operons repressor
MSTLLNSKDKVITKLIKVFREYGYDGTTLAMLSKATGLGRASLYHYFPYGKKEMALAALDYTNKLFKKIVCSPLNSSGTPKERFCEMINNLDKFYEHGEYICLLGVLTIGDSHNFFETEIRQTFNFWIDSMAEVFEESGFEPDCARRQAENCVLQIQGALLLARGLGDITIFKRVSQHLPNVLFDDRIIRENAS